MINELKPDTMNVLSGSLFAGVTVAAVMQTVILAIIGAAVGAIVSYCITKLIKRVDAYFKRKGI